MVPHLIHRKSNLICMFAQPNSQNYSIICDSLFRNMDVLKKDEWTSNVTKELRTFEKSLITALKQKGNKSFSDVHIFYACSYNNDQDF